MISEDLLATLQLAIGDARKQRYETLSVEQLLLALLHNPRAAEVLRACSVDVTEMHSHLSALVRDNTPVAVGTAPVGPEPSAQFQRVIQRAMMHVQATRGRIGTSTGIRRTAWRVFSRVLAPFKIFIGRGMVDGVDALVAVFGEKDSQAVAELRHHGATRLDVIKFISHGIRKSDADVLQVPRAEALENLDVVLLNDNFTPMEFVVGVLRENFKLDAASAEQVMLKIHREGRAVCGRFATDVAVETVELVRAAARREEHPLRCILEAGFPQAGRTSVA